MYDQLLVYKEVHYGIMMFSLGYLLIIGIIIFIFGWWLTKPGIILNTHNLIFNYPLFKKIIPWPTITSIDIERKPVRVLRSTQTFLHDHYVITYSPSSHASPQKTYINIGLLNIPEAEFKSYLTQFYLGPLVDHRI